ncbi:MAG: ribosome silencing factor [Prevotellaceae bacterium]|jgi:ribosome-associated protein|nr:ribosome silencing factor [Prevotellaceae bacterium]
MMGKKDELISPAKKNEKVKTEQDNSATVLNVIVEAMLEKKASKILDLNLSNLDNSICDHFIITNANSTTQVAAIADNVEDKMIERLGIKLMRRGGDENALWIILDYGNIMVHVFQTEYRSFYKLEELWADALITSYDE